MRIYPGMTILSCLLFFSMDVQADSALNLNFLHGAAKDNVPNVLSSNKKYPEGQYILDIIFNKQNIGRQTLEITAEDSDSLCLSYDWLSSVGLPLKMKSFEPYLDSQRQCYLIGKFPDVRVDFDYSSQTLRFSVPQVAIREKNSVENWDYGIPGFRLSWSGNASKSDTNNEQIYGNFDLNMNLGRWVLFGKTSGFNGKGFSTPEATLSTAIAPIRGNLLLGKTMTASTLLPDFGFYGASLRSDNTMVPWSVRGYAPQISGVAATNARVTVSQGGYTILSEIVPPGAYSLNNIRPVGNGDLTVTIEEENGEKTIRTYPVTTLPTLLRAGDFNYNVVVGTRADDIGKHLELPGAFTLASLDYGLTPLTLNAATILHADYQSLGMGVSKDFGLFGALSASVNASRSVFKNDFTEYDRGKTQSGISGMLKYAKGLSNETSLQLLSYRYTGEKYVDFASFSPKNLYSRYDRKDRFEAIITKSFSKTYLSASGWTQTYRNSDGNDIGANLNISTSFDQFSLSLNGNYGKYRNYGQDDYSVSMSLSVPFMAFDRHHYNTNSIAYTRSGKTSFNTGVTGNLEDHVNYSLNSGLSESSKSSSAYAGISFAPVQVGMSVSQSDNMTGMTLSASGSVIGTRPTGLLFSRDQNNTVAVVRLKDVPGVSFNGSAPTNSKGSTVINISPYINNDIRINTEQVPDNMELMNSVYSVVPTERAIIYRDFAHENIKRYILRVMGRDGKPLMAGSLAKTDQGVNAGFVSNGGILLVNVLAEPKNIVVRQQNGKQCQFSMQSMVAGENKTREVFCE